MDDNPDRMTLFRFDFDFLRNRYDYELQRKEQLTAALALPVAVLSILGSATLAMVRSFSQMDRALTWGFGSLVTLDVVASFVCLVYLAFAYHQQKYEFLPLLTDIDGSRNEFLEFAKVMAGGEAEVLEEFEKQMRGRMIKAADWNTVTNDRRSGYLHRARRALFAVLFLTTVTALVYGVDQVRF